MTKRAWSATETIPTLQAFIRHLQRDSEAKRARAALAEVEAKRKALQLRRQLGQLVTLDELRDLAGELWSGIWSAWQISAATFYAHEPSCAAKSCRCRIRTGSMP